MNNNTLSLRSVNINFKNNKQWKPGKNIKNNINIFDFELSEDDMKAIHALARPDGRQIDPDWGPEWDQAA